MPLATPKMGVLGVEGLGAAAGMEFVGRFDGEREMLFPILIQHGGSTRAIVVERVADVQMIRKHDEDLLDLSE